MSEGPPLSPTDKKRNKLGYHRTAVACGHCRRRKIRCIPAFDDNSGRCQNCIRLKKDCQFFPVDQQTPPSGAKRLRKPNEGFLNESEASVSSSPAGGILRSSSFDRLDQSEDPLNTPPLSRGSPGFQYQQNARSFSGHAIDYPHSYDVGHPQQVSQAEYLTSPYSNQSIRSYGMEQTNSQYFSQYATPTQGQYSSAFSPASLSSSGPALSQESSYQYPSTAPNGYAWGHGQSLPLQTSRSLSIGESEGSQGFPPAYRTHTYPSLDRRSVSDMQHHSSTVPTFHRMSTEGQVAPMAAPYRDPASYQSMQGWHNPGMSDPGQGIGVYQPQWYSQQGLGDLREEEDMSALMSAQGRRPHGQHKPG
ncbi:hypothetical protein B0A52_08248 [Exophiala mesophila]|uniref:Zn(2)-C6 fungal-type domain-containing protein n=1 Tax=Exophiala mesophila TaxID=212818 RepID=A0A438MWG9_EXOME|nr:hypothetical protein B0A52_08248 [Exophiala mesophila]